MIVLFAGIGLSTVAIIVMLVLWLLVEKLTDLLHELKWKYTYKHRFDKPPIAKCYCKDCIYYGRIDDNTLCQSLDRHLPSDWFCKDAKPKSAK